MPRNVWTCDMCRAEYTDREAAEQCEGKHARVQDVTIVGMRFERFDQRRRGAATARLVPTAMHVTIRAGDTVEYAEYRLQRIGMKGL